MIVCAITCNTKHILEIDIVWKFRLQYTSSYWQSMLMPLCYNSITVKKKSHLSHSSPTSFGLWFPVFIVNYIYCTLYLSKYTLCQ